MLIGSVCFAAMALLAESLRDQFTYPWITMVRSGIATTLAIALTLLGGAQLVFLRPVTLWIRSLSGWASMICGFYAITHYDVEIVLALTNMYPLWVAILSWPLLGKTPSLKTWLALFVSCIGMWLVYASSISFDTIHASRSYNPRLAIPMAVLAGMLSGVALINLHRVKHIDTRAWKWQSKREPARQPKRGPVYGWVTRGVREALVSTLKAYLTVLGGTQGAQNGRFRTYSADGFDRRILAT